MYQEYAWGCRYRAFGNKLFIMINQIRPAPQKKCFKKFSIKNFFQQSNLRFARKKFQQSKKVFCNQNTFSQSKFFFESNSFLNQNSFFRINLGSRSWLGPTHRRGRFRDPAMVQKGKKRRTRLHFGAESMVISGTPANQTPASPPQSKKVF